MNVYIQELKMSVKSAAYWTVGLIVVLVLFSLMFPSLFRDTTLMQQVLAKFPPEIIKALGLATFDISTFLGFYGFLFTYLLLIASIYAMKAGISVLSEEARAKTSDFLLVKPISRNTIVTAKLMSVLTNLLVQNIVFIIAAFIMAGMVSNQAYDKGILLLINLSMLLVQLFFVALGLLISVVMKKIKTVLPVTLGIVFGFFVIQLLNQSLSDAKLAYITPFGYFDTEYIIQTASLKGSFIAIDLILIAVFTVLTYIIYNRKDMPSV